MESLNHCPRPERYYPAIDMSSSAPTASQGPTSPATTANFDAWFLAQANDTVSGTPFISTYNLGIAFGTNINCNIPTWG